MLDMVGNDFGQFWDQIWKSFNKELFYLDKDKKIRRKFKVGIGL